MPMFLANHKRPSVPSTAVGSGRNLAIQVLEFFVSIGVTRRNGDLRKIRPDYELVVGSAAPYVPAP